MSYERPYKGIRVVDMSQGVAGPYCAMLLARNGADVIKIEPASGDWARHIGEIYGDHSAFSIAANLGKRSIVVDLKHENSRAIMDRMVEDADVFIEGFRPGVTERLGYGYERLKAINPGLIYVSISGFGQAGPMRERPAMDPVLQAFTGFMGENKGADDVPHRTPVILFDMSTALYAQQAVASTLYARRNHGGLGRRIDVSLMEGAANLQAVRLLSGHREGPYRIAGAPSGTFRTKDGWLQVIVALDREFQRLCKGLGWPEIATDPKFETVAGRRENAEFLLEKMRALLATMATDHWKTLFTEAGVQHEAVLSYREFVEHPQPEAIGLFSWLVQPGSGEPWPIPNVPGTPPLVAGDRDAHAPTLGEHTRGIMRDVGYTAEEIETFFADRVIA